MATFAEEVRRLRIVKTVKNYLANCELIEDIYKKGYFVSKQDIVFVVGQIGILFAFLEQSGLQEAFNEKLNCEPSLRDFVENIKFHWYCIMKETSDSGKFMLCFTNDKTISMSCREVIKFVEKCAYIIVRDLVEDNCKSGHGDTDCHLCMNEELNSLVRKMVLASPVEKDGKKKNSCIAAKDKGVPKSNDQAGIKTECADEETFTDCIPNVEFPPISRSFGTFWKKEGCESSSSSSEVLLKPSSYSDSDAESKPASPKPLPGKLWKQGESESSSSSSDSTDEAKSVPNAQENKESGCSSKTEKVVIDTYTKYCENIMEQYNKLKQWWEKNKSKKPGTDKNWVLTFFEGTKIRDEYFKNKKDAKEWLWENYKPGNNPVFDIHLLKKSPCAPKKVETTNVGTEFTAYFKGRFEVPKYNIKSKRIHLFIDTGADGGCVGYNPELVKDFWHTVEKIEGKQKIVILSKISIDDQLLPLYHQFEIERDEKWNAVGLEQLKNLTTCSVNKCMRTISKPCSQSDCPVCYDLPTCSPASSSVNHHCINPPVTHTETRMSSSSPLSTSCEIRMTSLNALNTPAGNSVTSCHHLITPAEIITSHNHLITPAEIITSHNHLVTPDEITMSAIP